MNVLTYYANNVDTQFFFGYKEGFKLWKNEIVILEYE